MTQLDKKGKKVAQATTNWPATAAQRESLESMLYLPQQTYTVTNTFATNQYGEVGLAVGSTPLRQPTDVARARNPGGRRRRRRQRRPRGDPRRRAVDQLPVRGELRA